MTEKKSLFSRLREGLFKSREHMSVAMEAAVQDDRPIDEDFYDDLLDALILSDMGATCATEAIDRLRERVKAEHLRYAPQAKDALKGILVEMLEVEKPALHWPMVTLMVGVNGVGKTTTIGKLALRFQGLGRTIILCAADTFRAAAAEKAGKGFGEILLQRGELPDEHRLHLLQQLGDQRAQVLLGAFEVRALRAQIGEALVHLRVFLDGAHVNRAHLAHAVADAARLLVGGVFVKGRG